MLRAHESFQFIHPRLKFKRCIRHGCQYHHSPIDIMITPFTFRPILQNICSPQYLFAGNRNRSSRLSSHVI